MMAWAVVLGGGLGALLRYVVVLHGFSRFPQFSQWGTLVVNLLGCFFMGLIWGVLNLPICESVPDYVKGFVITGFLGAFTTFSAFGLDIVVLFASGKVKVSLLYFFVSNVLGVGLVLLGLTIVQGLRS